MRFAVLGMFWWLNLLHAYGIAGFPSPTFLNSSITSLITNDLQGTDSPFADSGLIILDARSFRSASTSCEELGEQLWAPELKTSDIQRNLNYLKYTEDYGRSPKFWIGPGNSTARSLDTNGKVSVTPDAFELPVLCTNSAPFSYATSQDTSEKWRVTVQSNNDHITGFRDRLSFRFLGIRYAAQPKRFAYPTLYIGNNSDISATQYGSECIQGTSGSEECHFLNIWTPFIPGPRSGRQSLRPVMFWIHGGAFTSGTANDEVFDGANLASRSDVVVVAVNYRLGTFGFLALQDGVTNGNFGLADQITSLDWVRNNIHNFGGDPDRITIFGQSAGAGSVRAMIASPKAIGKFAAAIPLSNLGGINYGTTYSKYMTIDQEVDEVGNAILASTNCTGASSQIQCLRSIQASELSNLGTVARYLVVDGTYLVSDELDLSKGSKLPIHLLIGTTRDDGAAFIGYPASANQTSYLSSLGFDVPSSELFPVPNITNRTLGLFNMTARLATDGIFRCIDQATTYAALSDDLLGSIYYYEFNRTYQTTSWPQLDVCEPPKSTQYPFGDPNGEYFKCHSGELYYLFGNLARESLPMRDDHDLPFQQFVTDTFSSFARTYNPNPDAAYLLARGYTNTTRDIARNGIWEPATKQNRMKRILQWPNLDSPFSEMEQCQELGLSLNYYSGSGTNDSSLRRDT
ncbi:Alpha/Beta hydrolase protein [Xylaria venustula]|nr:Alpha/Beta hydrolase protein [Xylaria venustula]